MSDTIPNWPVSTPINDEVVDVLETPADHSASGSIDLSAKFGAWLFISVAREDATAVAAGIRINVRRTDGTRAVKNSPFSRVGGTVTAVLTNVDADSASGQSVLNVTTTTNFAVDDFIAIGDPSDGSRLEFARIAKITNPGAGGELVLDTVLEFTHTAVQGDQVTTQADLWQMWLPGGDNYIIEADYGRAATGPDVVVRAIAQIYNKLVTT